ncbi:hypothetical protein SAMN02800694_1448 [Luteibacter sp. UNCMF331Sha3.1]|uniref:hypothetical protein n=1 Tax=Luteibacter sp. UNCMF331Sha3.1 TaxID=1502760 RepID=UPI0008B831A4|nr:hypothetical protein [Luteibacter sp. UNCMF331Sha3.1]SEM54248.1 hypothetical protein SAMN02800694_1448 [Luteibacter sp. UNCMF331Sha3.1]
MKWINVSDLATWAERVDARAELPNLVRHLIKASIPDWRRLRFPGGDQGQVRGWDGVLETAEAAKAVPQGKSKWEFGTGAGERKATDDYNKRTKASGLSPEEQHETTFVLVNLEPWDTPRTTLVAWETSRTAEGVWKEVKYIDAIELVQWLDEFPAVAARYARNVLGSAPRVGALSTDEFWEMYSRRFKIPLNEKVVIGDRTDDAEELVQKLQNTAAQAIPICVETAVDGIAFAVAAIRSAPSEVREAIELRTLIVETADAARELSDKSLNLIAHQGAGESVGWLSSRMPTAYAVTGVQARRLGLMKRSSAAAMAEGFLAMGMSREEGYELAYRCGRSLTVLSRIFSDQPVENPAWVAQAQSLKPALLAGGWVSSVPLDCQAVAQLSGLSDYHSLEETFRAFALHDDPPLDRVSSQWQVRAPVDAFTFYAPLLTQRDLERLREVAVTVLGHAAPVPSRDEIFRPGREWPADYSKSLRDGLAMTLLLIACLHSVVDLQLDEGSPQTYVDNVVRSLPNLGRSHEWIIALGQQAALVAEAAPSPFMSALESMLEGQNESLSSIFVDSGQDLFAQHSPHVELIWAIEGLAWHSEYLDRAVLILGGLAAIDVSETAKYGNRPINSLREILLPWSPSTYGDLAQRIGCLDQLIAKYPVVSWALLLRLMPNPHDSSVDTHRPRLRDPRPMDQEVLTYGLVWDGHSAVVDRAVTLAQGDSVRVAELLSHIPFMSEKDSSKVIDATEILLQQLDADAPENVLGEIRELVSRADYLSTDSNDDSVPLHAIERLRELLEEHGPASHFVEARRLFDEWLPISRASEDTSQKRLRELRVAALRSVFYEEGACGVLSVLSTAKIPELVGPVLLDLPLSGDDLENIIISARANGNPGNVMAFASLAGLQVDPEWRSRVVSMATGWSDDPHSAAALVAGWSLNHETWDFVEQLGDAIRQQYWINMRFLPEDDEALLLRGVAELMRVGRPMYVLAAAHRSLNRLPTKTLVDVMRSGLASGSDDAVEGGGTMLSYYLKAAFLELKKRVDVDVQQLVGFEYAYFPLLEYEKMPLAIYDKLATDPEFFVGLLSHVFRAENEPAREGTEAEARQATNSFRILSAFTKVPGQIEHVESAGTLYHWVARTQELAKELGRAKIADTYIGKLLAYSPSVAEGELWPSAPVCEVLEELSTESLLDGFRMECFNKRGVYSKSPYEGGKQERALAARYKQFASLAKSYPRTSQLLSSVAKDWESQAAGEDIRAEQDKMSR